jgi:hypothetical protein
VGGEIGWAGPLAPAACPRLACDGAVTRVLVCRQPSPPWPPRPGQGSAGPAGHHHTSGQGHPPSDRGLAGRLQTALAWLPPLLGGAPGQPLDVGRTSRVVTPAQHSALAVGDGGWVFPDCPRPLAWWEAHQLWPWLDGGPTDLANLALLCRAHHRAVHEGAGGCPEDPTGG